MNFFNDIGRGFQDLGNKINNDVIQPINNEVIKPVEHEVLKIQDVPKQIENIPNKIETQINNELKKINPRLRLPPPKVITTKDINDAINTLKIAQKNKNKDDPQINNILYKENFI